MTVRTDSETERKEWTKTWRVREGGRTEGIRETDRRQTKRWRERESNDALSCLFFISALVLFMSFTTKGDKRSHFLIPSPWGLEFQQINYGITHRTIQLAWSSLSLWLLL